MKGAYKTTTSKRDREQRQRDRVKEREARRDDRRARATARAAAGEVGLGPPIGAPQPPLGDIEVRPAQRDGSIRDKDRNMGTKIYVGNLSFETTADTVRALFAEQGEVTDVHLPTDRETGRQRGFAFVTMGSPADAEKAIRANDGRLLDGRPLRVNEAEDRPRGGGFGGRRGGGRGGRF